MPVIETYPVEAKGIGRRDYSSATEVSVEPVICSWQNLYTYSRTATVPALGTFTRDVEVPLAQVVLLYDVFASIPANYLIRVILQAIDAVGTVMTAFDKSRYQQISHHFNRGYPFFQTIRYTVYNYRPVDETNFVICWTGMYTSLDEYYMRIH